MRRQNHLLACSGWPFPSCLTVPAKSHPSTANSYLALLGGDGGIPVDELCEDTSQGLNAQGQGSYIQQQHICHITSQHPALDGCSNGHSLIRIDCFARSTAKQLLHSLLHLRGDTAQLIHRGTTMATAALAQLCVLMLLLPWKPEPETASLSSVPAPSLPTLLHSTECPHSSPDSPFSRGSVCQLQGSPFSALTQPSHIPMGSFQAYLGVKDCSLGTVQDTTAKDSTAVEHRERKKIQQHSSCCLCAVKGKKRIV